MIQYVRILVYLYCIGIIYNDYLCLLLCKYIQKVIFTKRLEADDMYYEYIQGGGGLIFIYLGHFLHIDIWSAVNNKTGRLLKINLELLVFIWDIHIILFAS